MKPHRILLVDNLMIRRYGNLRMGPGRKLMTGAIRNNWRICEFSDRDMARLLAPLGIRPIGEVVANKKLVKTAKNFKPDVLLVGHCDYIRNWALEEIRAALPGIRIAHFNVDPVYIPHMQDQCKERMHSCDGIFVTTAGEPLKQWCTGKNFVSYMPNPSDPSMENRDNSKKKEFLRDLFFAGNPLSADRRWELLAEVLKKIQGKMKIDIFGWTNPPIEKPEDGLKFNPGVWGANYENVLESSKMSLNLNRREGDLWYSSDRIAHLMGFGILTFQSSLNRMQDFFTEDETVFFDTAEDLAEKILYYNSHDGERARIAFNGREKYHKIFSGERVLKFMVETLCEEPYSEDYEWASQVMR